MPGSNDDVPGIKRSNGVLAGSENLYRLVLENFPGLAYRYDCKRNRYDFVSPAVERVIGFSDEVLCAMDFSSLVRLIHQDDLGTVERVMREAHERACRAGVANANVEYRFKGKNSRYVWLSDNFTFITDGSGKPAYRTGYVYDVTDHKLAEEALQKSVERFKLLAALAGGLLHTAQPQEALQELCGKIMEYLGCSMFVNFLANSKSRKIRMNACAGVTDEDAAELESCDYGWGVSGTVAHAGVPVIAEHIQTRADSRAEWLKSRGFKAYACYPLLGADGELIGTLGFGTGDRDTFSGEELLLIKAVTDEVAVALVRNRGVEALRESEQRFRRFFENSPDIIARVDKQLRYVYFNPAIKAVTGLSPAYYIGKTRWEAGMPVDFCTLWDKQLRHVFASGKLSGFECRLRDVKGIERCYYSIIVPEFDSSGEVASVFSVSRDISASKQVEEVLRRDKQTLERLVNKRTEELIVAQVGMEKAKRLADIGTLAATVAHELRNPLAAIAMAGANIKKKSENASLRNHLLTIEKKVQESEQIISNLLFYSRLKPPHLAPVSLLDTLNESVKAAKIPFAERAIAITLRAEAIKGLIIEADPVQLKEVFSNILNNAADAIPTSVKGSIVITASLDKRKTVIAIRDNGIGMSEEVRKKAGDPFFTTKSKGTGLGLSVCWQIIKLHKGSIKIDSEEGKGSTVFIAVPLRRGEGRKNRKNE